MKAGDPVLVVPYDTAWPELFQQLAHQLREALGSIALRIDHIGSTSVPQLEAKPIIDIQISVSDFDPLVAYKIPLEKLGYIFRDDNPELTKRYFREPPGERRVHIHVRRAGSFSEQLSLLFRDYLRNHPDIAYQYAQLKIELAQQHAHVNDHVAYTEAKDPFIWQVIARADKWAQQIGWVPEPSDA
jgi:GrpB-like predicted nucleotidyltransferase (UPF0157 family)